MARPTGPGWPARRQVGGNLPAHPIRGVPTLPRAVVHASCVLRTAPPPLALPRSAGCQPVVSPTASPAVQPIANRRYAARMRRRVCELHTLRDCPGAQRARLRVECGRLRLLFCSGRRGLDLPPKSPRSPPAGTPRRGRGAGKKMSSAVSPPTPKGPPRASVSHTTPSSSECVDCRPRPPQIFFWKKALTRLSAGVNDVT
jgi:hypothetical protein